MFFDSGADFEDHMPDGVVIVGLLEMNACGSCVQIRSDLQKMGNLDSTHAVVVDIKKHPEVRPKYGVKSDIQIMVYKNRSFVCRLFPSQYNYQMCLDLIDKVRDDLPVYDLYTKTHHHPMINIIRIPHDQFDQWIQDPKNSKYITQINNRILFDPCSNEFMICGANQ